MLVVNSVSDFLQTEKGRKKENGKKFRQKDLLDVVQRPVNRDGSIRAVKPVSSN